MKLKALLIEDETGAREALVHLITTCCPQVELIAQAASVQEARTILSHTLPDVLLLDIRLGDGTGFDLLTQLPSLACQVIFITAYDQYALQALKVSAVDYLLKPVDPDELIGAFQKAEKVMNQTYQRLKIDTLAGNLHRQEQRVVLATQESLHVVNVSEIIRCEAADNYTQFVLTSHSKLLVSQTLREYEELLEPYGFFRSHRSHLINLYHLKRYDKKEGGIIIMSDLSQLPLAPPKKEAFLHLLTRIKK